MVMSTPANTNRSRIHCQMVSRLAALCGRLRVSNNRSVVPLTYKVRLRYTFNTVKNVQPAIWSIAFEGHLRNMLPWFGLLDWIPQSKAYS